MSEKKKPISTLVRVSLDSDSYLGEPVSGSGRREEGVLDKLKKDALRDRVERIQEREADLYLKEVEEKLEKREGKEGSGEGKAEASPQADLLTRALMTDPKAQKQWLDYTEEQRNIILGSIQALSSIGASGDLGSVLPFMMLKMNQNPGSSVKDMVELIKVVSPSPAGAGTTGKDIVEAVRLGVELAGGKPEGSLVSVYDKFVKPVMEETQKLREEFAKERVGKLEKEIEGLKSRPDAIASLTQKKAELIELRDIFGSGSASGGKTNELDLKLEDMRETHAFKIAEMGLNLQKWALERQLDTEKWEVVKDMLNPIVAVAGKPIEDTLRNLGRGGKAQEKPQKPPEVAQQKEAIINIPCKTCGAIISLKPPYPDTFKCPSCGTEHQKDKPQEQKQDKERVE